MEGCLGYMQLSCRLSDFGLDENEIDVVFKKIDTDSDEKITLMEWCRAFPNLEGEDWIV